MVTRPCQGVQSLDTGNRLPYGIPLFGGVAGRSQTYIIPICNRMPKSIQPQRQIILILCKRRCRIHRLLYSCIWSMFELSDHSPE